MPLCVADRDPAARQSPALPPAATPPPGPWRAAQCGEEGAESEAEIEMGLLTLTEGVWRA
jgi:hypothetical protein